MTLRRGRRKRDSAQAKITRRQVAIAVEQYLESGGKITQLYAANSEVNMEQLSSMIEDDFEGVWND